MAQSLSSTGSTFLSLMEERRQSGGAATLRRSSVILMVLLQFCYRMIQGHIIYGFSRILPLMMRWWIHWVLLLIVLLSRSGGSTIMRSDRFGVRGVMMGFICT